MSSKRPNVLFIMTDQQRADTIGALGNPVIKTPNLDRLVYEGTSFTSGYTPAPECVPGRASLYYGQYPCHTRCYNNGTPMPDDGRPTFFGKLTEAGYRTHGIGKVHFTGDRAGLRGFESRQQQEELVPDRMGDDYLRYLAEQGFDHVTDPHGVRGEMYYVPQPAQMPARHHPTQWLGDESVKYIEEACKSDKPWHLFSSFIHPHPPFAPPVPWHKLYRAPLMPLPKIPADNEAMLTYINRHQNRYKYRDQGYDLNLVRCQIAYYYACISFIDMQAGRMLDTLEAAGQLDNTLILYTSDHGELLGDYRSFGKRSFHDSASRVPLLARYPDRFEAGLQCDRPTNLVDVMPTVLAAAGVDQPNGLDGEDLATIADGSSTREAIFGQQYAGNRATYFAVTDRWKYVYSAPDDQAWLIDRVGDPEETRNRSGVSLVSQHETAMRTMLIDHLKTGGEEAALEGDNFKRYPKLTVPANPDAGLLIQDSPWADQRVPGYSD